MELFRAAVRRTPESVAVVDPAASEQLTYRQLERRAAGLARQFLRRRRVSAAARELRVAVLLESGLDRIVALLATLAAGGAYVPLDPVHPRDRLERLLADARPDRLLTEDRLTVGLRLPPGVRTMPPRCSGLGDQRAAAAPARPQAAAYVIYTSGSSGRPKGVVVEQRSLAWYTEAAIAHYGLVSQDRILQLASIGFDISVEEIFPCLARGATLVLRDASATASAEALGERCRAWGITCLFMPTALWHELAVGLAADPGLLPGSVRLVSFGGEAVWPERIADWRRALGGRRRPRLMNTYGPTEATVVATLHELTDGGRPESIGRPLVETRAVVLDRRGRALPAGEVGELAIAGEGVARGYLDAPAATAAVFTPDPHAAHPGARRYRTGDRARWSEDGRLELLGRLDEQVKIRGFRVEPGEVAAVLLRHPRVTDAAVVARGAPPGERRLVAYAAVSRDALVGAGELARQLRRHLEQRLPAPWVPAVIVPLARLPRTPNGKLDRTALPPPEAAESLAAAAGNAVERALLEIWSDVFGRPVRLEDDFFALGGDSILGIRIAARGRERGLLLAPEDLFHHRCVAALAARVEAAGAGPAPAGASTRMPSSAPAQLPEAEDSHFLTPLQEGLLFHSLLEPASAAYCDQLAWTLSGELDTESFRRAWELLVERHGALRSAFAWEEDGRPRQVVSRRVELPWEEHDWRHLEAAERRARLSRLLAEDRRRGFELRRPPLLRWTLVRLAEESWQCVWSSHHLLLDGWSTRSLLAEVGALYRAVRRGEAPDWPRPRPFSAYVGWSRRRGSEASASFWRAQLAGLGAATPLPSPDAAAADGEAALPERVRQRLPTAASARLGAFARRHGLTLNSLVQGAWGLLLARASAVDDVVFGVTSAGRPPALRGVEEMVGMLMQTLPLRLRATPRRPLLPWLRRLQERNLELRRHEHSSLADIQTWSGVRPLFESLVVFESLPPAAALADWLPGVAAQGVEDWSATHYPLHLRAVPDPGLELELRYLRRRYSAAAARRLLRQVCALLSGMADAPRRSLGDLSHLSPAERHQLLAEWSGRSAGRQRPATSVHGLFAAQAVRTPAAVALVCAEQRLSYRELQARAGRLARQLRRRGVGPETVVAIHLERCAALVVGMLAVLEAGGVTLALDPAAAPGRLASQLAEARPRLLLSGPSAAPEVPGVAVLRLGRGGELESPGHSSTAPAPPGFGGAAGHARAAYVCYTSGSSGRPKGVLGHIGGAAAYLRHVVETYGLDHRDVILQVASCAFDSSLRDLFAPLLAGARVVLLDEATVGDPARWPAAIERHRVSCLLSVVPSQLVELLAAVDGGHRPGRLRLVLLSGERLSMALAARARRCLGERVQLVNQYGPTECTCTASAHRLAPPRAAAAGGSSVPVGRPDPAARIFVLSGDLRPVAIGEPGMVYIGGAGLARGYLARAAATAAAFIPHPFAQRPGARLYRTGDLARYRADGVLELAGRADRQLKIRGLRVEPGEVEAVLQQHPRVVQAAVLARRPPGRDEVELAAFVVAQGPQPAAEELRRHLVERLPIAMLPASFRFLSQLPRTANKKVDRGALSRLQEPRGDDRAAGGAVAAPRTPIEDIVAGIWCQVLRRDEVGRDESFFDLGGHSLLATRILARLRRIFRVELPLRGLFEAPTVAALAARLAGRLAPGHRAGRPAIARRPRRSPPPLSFAQERLWFLEQLERSGATAYHLSAVAHLAGALDAGRLEHALGRLAARHEVLRSRFPSRDGRPVVTIAPPAVAPLPRIDLLALPAARRGAAAEQLIRQLVRRPFDLARGPLLAAALLRLGRRRHRLLLCLHHIVADGESMPILMRELMALYGSGSGAGRLAPLPVQYGDFAVWQRRHLGAQHLEPQRAYWRRRLADLPTLRLPTDRPRTAGAAARRAVVQPLVLDATVSAALERAGRDRGLTLFMTLLAALTVLLRRWSGQSDLALGTPVAQRCGEELEGLIGLFVNTLVLRLDDSRAVTFPELSEKVREAVLDAHLHRDLPFEKLVEELAPARDLGRHPLFQVALAWHGAPLPASVAAGLTATWSELAPSAAKLDLDWNLWPTSAGLRGELVGDGDLFDAATLARLSRGFERLLAALADNPERRLEELPLLSAAQRHQLLAEWSGASTDPSPFLPVHQRFASRAAAHPEATALLDAGGRLRYGELAARAWRLARYLRRRGVGPEVVVALDLPRRRDLLVAVLAVLAAGGVYLPLDAASPWRRRRALARASGAAWVLTRGDVRWGAQAVCLERDGAAIARCSSVAPALSVAPGNAAYALYTSGSTGAPRAVLVRHDSLAAHTADAADSYRIGPRDRVLQFAAFGFDTSAEEIFPALARGAALVLRDDAMLRTVPAFLEAVERYRITVLDLPTAYWHELCLALAADRLRLPPSVRLVILGGERALAHRLREWRRTVGRSVRLVNSYGPTEATIVSTRSRVDQDGGSEIPLGRPIAGARVYLLGAGLQPVPQGGIGELFLGGAGVARGYLGRPHATAARFVPSPFCRRAGARLFATGDLARHRADGELEFLGRRDHQVKIRGFRVEPGEVAAQLEQHPEVAGSAVLAREDRPGDHRLVAYLAFRQESDGNGLRIDALRRWLRRRLPVHMIPATFVELAAMPRSVAGKIDLRALPPPNGHRPEGTYSAPRSALEKSLAETWAEVLGVERVGRADDFFALGGHSLLAVRLRSRIERRFAVRLPLATFFLETTIEELARVIGEQRRTAAPAATAVPA